MGFHLNESQTGKKFASNPNSKQFDTGNDVKSTF
jgi:hypothetical protein